MASSPHYHTVKHAYASIMVMASDLAQAETRSRWYLEHHQWEIQAVEEAGHQIAEPPDHSEESKTLYHRAVQHGVALDLSTVSADPDSPSPSSN